MKLCKKINMSAHDLLDNINQACDELARDDYDYKKHKLWNDTFRIEERALRNIVAARYFDPDVDMSCFLKRIN